MMGVAERLGYREGNPCRGVPRYKERHRERYLSREEIARLGTMLGDTPEDRELRILLLTGLRPSELFTAKPENVSEKGLRLDDSKVGARIVPLANTVRLLLSSTLPFDGGIRGKVARRWREMRKLLALDGVRVYDLRHSWASHALDSGATLVHIGAVLGHRSIQTTSRYAHADTRAVSRLADETAGKLSSFLGN
jgi:integrase